MKMGIDLSADKKIRDLILSWHISTRLIFIITALFTVPYVTRFIYQISYYLFYLTGYHKLYFTINSVYYYLAFFNTHFGGIFILVFFLIQKRGETANIILASPIKYPRVEIKNIWLRVFIYFTAIIGFGFLVHFFRILFGITNSLFVFPADIFDFLIKTFFAPISEEMYYRFLILYITAALFGKIPAVFISTFFFTISHNLSQPHQVLWATSMGFTNALLTIAYGTLWPAIGIHIINNMVVYLNHPF